MSRPFPSLQLDQDLLVGPADSGAERVQAARAADRSWASIYSGHGRPLTIDLTRLAGPTLRAWWYDPRIGAAVDRGPLTPAACAVFTPPTSGYDQDCVLVVDDATRGFTTPGCRLSAASGN